jgi:hypothetical protein
MLHAQSLFRHGFLRVRQALVPKASSAQFEISGDLARLEKNG